MSESARFRVRWTLIERHAINVTAVELAGLLGVDAAVLAAATDEEEIQRIIDGSDNLLADELATYSADVSYDGETYREDIRVVPVERAGGK